MSRLPLRLALVAAALASTVAVAQPAPPVRPPAMAPAADTAQTVTGRVQQWLVNPNGEVDGLLLDDGTQVAFPPHLSARVLQAVTLKDAVQVTGWRGKAGVPVIRASLLKDTARNTSVADEPPAAGALPPGPRDAATLASMTTSGKVTAVLHGPAGDANGAIVDGGTIVRFPPHVGVGLGTALAVGQPLYARGFGTRTDHGSALEATAIGATAETTRETFGPPPGPLADARAPRRGPAGTVPQAGPGAPPPAASAVGPR